MTENAHSFRIIRRWKIFVFECYSCNCLAEYTGDDHPDNPTWVIESTDKWRIYDCPNCGEHQMAHSSTRMEEISE